MILVNVVAIHAAAQHRPAGYVEEMLAAGAVEGDYVSIPDETYDALVLKYAGCLRPCGPGCQLKRLLAKAGLKGAPGCQCEARAAIMDDWGPGECSKPERMSEILGWLKEEADRRELPFIEIAARTTVKLAIRFARMNAKAVAAASPPT